MRTTEYGETVLPHPMGIDKKFTTSLSIITGKSK
jgi:hypothetical protein